MCEKRIKEFDRIVKRPYVKIHHPELCDGWYGSYDASCVLSRWECLPKKDKSNLLIRLFDDTAFLGYISEEELIRIVKVQQGEVDNKGERQYCLENFLVFLYIEY